MNEYEKNDDEQSQLGQETGAKFDGGKSRWDLMPGDVLLEIADNTRTIIGLHEMETKIQDIANKTLFHYSNGMEAAWSFWVGKDKVPIEAGSQIPLIFASISYIHLLDLCLIGAERTPLDAREELFKYEIPNCGGFYLLPYRVLDYLGDIYLYGCKKYDENNWRKGMPWGKIFAAFCRHSGQWLDGEDFDEESGLHHIGHALWQLLGLRWYQQNKTDMDDRWINE